MAKGSSKGTAKVAKSAISGKFVTKGYASTHKSTTVLQTVKKGSK
jgi:hypothetical protein